MKSKFLRRLEEDEEELRLEPWALDGSTIIRRKSSRISVPTERYSADLKVTAPKSRRGARSIAPTLKTLKGCAQRGLGSEAENHSTSEEEKHI